MISHNDSLASRIRGRAHRSLLGAVACAILALAVTAPQAFAAPTWGISLSNSPTSMPRSDEAMNYTASVTNTGTTPTAGEVVLTVALPAGSDVSVFEAVGTGWSCSLRAAEGPAPAGATCRRQDALNPSAGYPALKLVARLGPNSEGPTATAIATVSGGGAATTASDDAVHTYTEAIPFGLLPDYTAGVFDELGNDFTKAGGHPFRSFTKFGFNMKTVPGINGINSTEYYPVEDIKDVVVDAPRGFVGNALSTPQFCDSVESVMLGLCPSQSIVGGITLYAFVTQQTKWYVDDAPQTLATDRPIYSLEPEFGQPAQFAFGVPFFGGLPYTFVPELRADEGYAISFRTAPIIQTPPLHGVKVDLCSFGVDTQPAIVDPSTGLSTGVRFGSCKLATDPGAYPQPLTTNPTRCSGPPPSVGLSVDSWQHPEAVKTYEYTAPAITDCDAVDFEPSANLQPTNTQADSPTGLTVEMNMPTDGLLSNTGVSQASLNNVTVTFPAGMSVNSAAADGLGSCTPAQIKMGSTAEDECPESSKVGSVEIDTPLIRDTLTGDIYVAKQNDNPLRAPIGLYMAFDSARDGVRVKIAGNLTPDPVTGQLVSRFVENPEWPFSRLALNFTSGPRAALVNPPRCGQYAIRTEFSPWSAVNPANPTPAEIVTQDSIYTVDKGPGGTPCPADDLAPKLSSGLQTPQAGAKSPFMLALTREDGSQRFNGLSVKPPPGLTAYLKGIPYCPDGVLAGIPGAEETGRPELLNPSCPAASQVGTVQAGAGAGPSPFQAPGKVYLAGPYKGAPVSLAVVTPAVAGPFDLGNVVIRNALNVDPVTAQVTATSDAIPTILHGLKLNLKSIRLALDRAGFTAAPTSCEPMTVEATVSGESGARANVSNRFQVSGCENLGFKPKLQMRLFGGTHRGSHPRLRAVLRPRPGDANIASASVALPHSEFLEQAHMRTICTRVQFAADQCPAGSIYGSAEATTPLIDSPLRGPVYLRSSENPLPDLVAALRGPDSQPIEVEVAGRIDSVHGGIRTTFETVPDQPVSSFTLNMLGGKKGLLVNSRDLCKSVNKATVRFTAHNNRSASMRPVLKNSCKKASKGKKSGRHRSR
jgi:hypothetical protein